jgi:hypothetical protein
MYMTMAFGILGLVELINELSGKFIDLVRQRTGAIDSKLSDASSRTGGALRLQSYDFATIRFIFLSN